MEKESKFSLRVFRQYMSVTYGRGGGGNDEEEEEEDEDWDYKEHWNYKAARKFKKERIKAERKERKPRAKGAGRRGPNVEKTYSDVDGSPDLIECDICQVSKNNRQLPIVQDLIMLDSLVLSSLISLVQGGFKIM